MRIAGVEIREQFRPADRRRSNLADDQAGGDDWRESRTLPWSLLPRAPERASRSPCLRRRSHRTPRAQMSAGGASRLEEQRHAFFSACDQAYGHSNFSSSLRPASSSCAVVFDRHAGQQFRFLMIRRDQRDRMVVIRVMNLRVEKHGNARALSRWQGLRQQAADSRLPCRSRKR